MPIAVSCLVAVFTDSSNHSTAKNFAADEKEHAYREAFERGARELQLKRVFVPAE